MGQLGLLNPPESIDGDLQRYLSRLFLQTEICLNQNNKIAISGTLPNKPRNGNIYYFNQVILPDILSAGFYGYADDEWVYLGANHSVTAAYGGVRITSPWSAADIGATWQTVAFDAEMLTIPRGIIQDTVNDGLGLQVAGVYSFGANLDVQHDEVNAGRVLQVRLHNPTTGLSSLPINIGTGINTSHTNISISGVLLELLATETGNVLQIQISSSSDSYSSVSVETGFMSATMVSERRF